MVREACQLDWLARRGSKGHMVLRAPDKVTTATIPPDVSAPRARENYYRPIKQWKKENLSEVDTKPDFACDQCDFIAASTNQLHGHKVSNHSKKQVCEYCQREMPTPAAYGQHIKSHLRQIAVDSGLSTFEFNGKTYDVHNPNRMKGKVIPTAPKIAPKKTAKKAAAPKRVPDSALAVIPKKLPAATKVSEFESLTNEQLIEQSLGMMAVLAKRLSDSDAKLEMLRETLGM